MPIDLNTLPDEDPEAPPLPDFNNLPPQGGGGQDAVQPGVYRFQAPKASMEQISKHADKMPTDKGPRLSIAFEDDIQLHCLSEGAPPRIRWQVNDMELARGKKDSAVFVSDLSYLFHATGYIPNSGGMKGQLAAIHAMCGGADPDPRGEWYMTASLKATCNKKNDIYKEVEGRSEKVAGTKGCGRVYTSETPWTPGPQSKVLEVLALPKDESGKYVTRVTCKCGASVRAFNDWRQIRGVE